MIDVQSKITDQKQSGRCWIFAFLNIIRYKMIQKYKLAPDFEFSQNYLFFFDKLEKANYFTVADENGFIKDSFTSDKIHLDYNDKFLRDFIDNKIIDLCKSNM
jgi:aminopeptidase C